MELKTRLPYSPQKHAAALADWTALLQQMNIEMSQLRGDVHRLLALHQSKPPAQDPALDDLIDAAFEAMGGTTWVTGELLGRALRVDAPGPALLQACAATGKATNARALGRYLAAQVPGAGHLTASGRELRRSGKCGTLLAWHIVEV